MRKKGRGKGVREGRSYEGGEKCLNFKCFLIQLPLSDDARGRYERKGGKKGGRGRGVFDRKKRGGGGGKGGKELSNCLLVRSS